MRLEFTLETTVLPGLSCSGKVLCDACTWCLLRVLTVIQKCQVCFINMPARLKGVLTFILFQDASIGEIVDQGIQFGFQLKFPDQGILILLNSYSRWRVWIVVLPSSFRHHMIVFKKFEDTYIYWMLEMCNRLQAGEVLGS